MSLYIGTTKIKNVNVLFNDGQGNITPNDIRKNITVMGIEGKFTSEETIAGANPATSNDIVSGTAAFINGEQLTGTLVVNNYYVSEEMPDNSLGNEGDLYLKL